MSKLLFIWYKRSKGILEGGGQGSLKSFRLCQSAFGDENIDSYYIHDEYARKKLTDYVRALWFFPMGYYYGLTPKRVDEIVDLAKKYDAVWIDRSIFGIIAKRLKEAGYKGKIYVHFHNVEKLYFDDAKLPKWLPGRSVLLNCVERNERWCMEYVDKVIALNERDSRILETLYGRKMDFLLPVSLEDKNPKADLKALTNKRLKCLSVGAYFAPNNEGILWFVKNVLPKVDIEYKIVGKGMGQLKKDEPKLLKDIEVVSDAPSLAPYLAEADVMILPIFAGSGMKVKTCECLMYGKNILGTNETFEGYEVDYKQVGGLCNTAEEFVAALQDIAANPRPRWNSYSRKMFMEKYSIDAQKEMFGRFMKQP